MTGFLQHCSPNFEIKIQEAVAWLTDGMLGSQQTVREGFDQSPCTFHYLLLF